MTENIEKKVYCPKRKKERKQRQKVVKKKSVILKQYATINVLFREVLLRSGCHDI